jgi:hypothetical protein
MTVGDPNAPYNTESRRDPPVKALGTIFNSVFSADRAVSRTTQIRREWDKQRARAMSPSELAEIDAIFSRNI